MHLLFISKKRHYRKIFDRFCNDSTRSRLRSLLVFMQKAGRYGIKTKTKLKASVAILAEISYFARNLISKSDGNLRSIGREILPKSARYFNWAKKSPKLPEISPKMDEIRRNLTSFQSKIFWNFFSKKISTFFQIFSKNCHIKMQ